MGCLLDKNEHTHLRSHSTISRQCVACQGGQQMKKAPRDAGRSAINNSRRDVLRLGGAASLAAATGFPLVNVARADSASLKIGYISNMSGPRLDFGATDSWVLERVKATVKSGLTINGKTYAVEFIM